ncbi:hypothetical protein D3C86_1812130 [compost metagenome]
MPIAIVAVLAVALHDFISDSWVSEVRGAAGEPWNVLRNEGRFDAGDPADLGPNPFEAFAPGKHGVVNPDSFWPVARRFGQNLDARPDLADYGRPHGPLL